MDREIEFRAWPREDYDGIIKMIEWGALKNYPTGTLDDDRFEIMQSTGLIDKDGKEIYEGDIVSGVTNHGVIVWDTKHAGWMVEDAQGTRDKLSPSKEGTFLVTKVIGNIYTTPELLE